MNEKGVQPPGPFSGISPAAGGRGTSPRRMASPGSSPALPLPRSRFKDVLVRAASAFARQYNFDVCAQSGLSLGMVSEEHQNFAANAEALEERRWRPSRTTQELERRQEDAAPRPGPTAIARASGASGISSSRIPGSPRLDLSTAMDGRAFPGRPRGSPARRTDPVSGRARACSRARRGGRVATGRALSPRCARRGRSPRARWG